MSMDSRRSIHSVRRYVSKLQQKTPQLVRRMEVAAGEEAQVDFGTGAWIASTDTATGKTSRRRSWVFRIVLSHSRKAYSEAVFHQSTEAFIGALENSFRYFGGVPKTLVIDNLKAAVKQADWYDPEIHPKLQSFAQHYGTVISSDEALHARAQRQGRSGREVRQEQWPERSRSLPASMPRTNTFSNGKIASPTHVCTAPRSSRCGSTLKRSNDRRCWRYQSNDFPFFHEKRRSVNRDGHIEVAKSYYSAPPEFVGRDVWVRWDSRLVRLFNERVGTSRRACTSRARSIPDGFESHSEEASVVHRTWSECAAEGTGHRRTLGKRLVGSHVAGTRSRRHPRAAGAESSGVKARCDGAQRCVRDSDVLRSIAAAHDSQIAGNVKSEVKQQKQFDFLEEHPVIRPLSDYSLESLSQFRKDRH